MLRDVELLPAHDLVIPSEILEGNAAGREISELRESIAELPLSYSTLLEVVEDLYVPAPGEAAPTLWDVEAALAANEQVWERIAQLTADSIPMPAAPEDVMAPEMEIFGFVLRYADLRIRAFLRAGDHRGALATLRAYDRFTEGRVRAPLSLLEGLFANALRYGQATNFAAIFRSGLLAPEEERALLHELALAARDVSPLEYAILGEYRLQCRACREFDYDVPFSPPSLFGEGRTYWIPYSLGYKPNRIQNALALRVRRAIAEVRTPYEPRATDSPPGAFDQGPPTGVLERAGALLRGNYVGESLFVNLDPQYRSLRISTLSRTAYLRATLVAIALYLHERDRGSVPSTLQALVPDYLGAVPLDPFDGQPIRFDVDEVAVYSVGSDGVDRGGGISSSADPEEPTVRLEDIRNGTL